MSKKKEPEFNELGIRELPVAGADICCHGFYEDRNSEDCLYSANAQVTITLEDGRRFTKAVEVTFEEEDVD